MAFESSSIVVEESYELLKLAHLLPVGVEPLAEQVVERLGGRHLLQGGFVDDRVTAIGVGHGLELLDPAEERLLRAHASSMR